MQSGDPRRCGGPRRVFHGLKAVQDDAGVQRIRVRADVRGGGSAVPTGRESCGWRTRRLKRRATIRRPSGTRTPTLDMGVLRDWTGGTTSSIRAALMPHHQSYLLGNILCGPDYRSCYTSVASNTTVVVRLLWVEPESPPNLSPFVFGVNKTGNASCCSPGSFVCAPRSLPPTEKEKKQ